VGCVERNARNLGGPGRSWGTGRKASESVRDMDTKPQAGKP
jgi:hypothetical protein